MLPTPTPEDPSRITRGIVLILAALILFAIQDATSKALMERYHFTQIMAIRFWLFFAFSLYMARERGIWQSLKSQIVWLQILRATVLVVEMACVVYSYSLLPLADVQAVMQTAPLLVLVVAGITLGETIGRRGWGSVLAGFLGALLIIRPGMDAFSVTLLVPVAGAVLWAVYQVLARLVGRRDPTETTLLYTTLVGLVAYSVFAPFTWVEPDAGDWALLLTVAVLGAAGHFLIIKAFMLAPASVLQPYNYSIFLWSICTGYVVFGDIPDWPTVTGASIIIVAGIVASDRDGRLWARLLRLLRLAP